MNLPYETAAEAVEFWRECAEAMGTPIQQWEEAIDTPYGIEHDPWVGVGDCFIEARLDSFVEHLSCLMLARCVLWLKERKWTVATASDRAFRMMRYDSDLDDYECRSLHPEPWTCVFTAHRDAVPAVKKEEA